METTTGVYTGPTTLRLKRGESQWAILYENLSMKTMMLLGKEIRNIEGYEVQSRIGFATQIFLCDPRAGDPREVYKVARKAFEEHGPSIRRDNASC